jgi:hypothetical protein
MGRALRVGLTQQVRRAGWPRQDTSGTWLLSRCPPPVLVCETGRGYFVTTRTGNALSARNPLLSR